VVEGSYSGEGPFAFWWACRAGRRRRRGAIPGGVTRRILLEFLEANRDWGELGAIMEGVIWHIYRRQEKGAIRGDDGAQVPFRKSSLGGVEFRALASGLRVSFRVQEGWLGKEAVDVCPLSPDQAQEKR